MISKDEMNKWIVQHMNNNEQYKAEKAQLHNHHEHKHGGEHHEEHNDGGHDDEHNDDDHDNDNNKHDSDDYSNDDDHKQKDQD